MPDASPLSLEEATTIFGLIGSTAIDASAWLPRTLLISTTVPTFNDAGTERISSASSSERRPRLLPSGLRVRRPGAQRHVRLQLHGTMGDFICIDGVLWYTDGVAPAAPEVSRAPPVLLVRPVQFQQA